jgi:hypothetical protein
MTPRRVTDRAHRDEESTPSIDVASHESAPDRIVFTEEGNTDGWIATDLTVELER